MKYSTDRSVKTAVLYLMNGKKKPIKSSVFSEVSFSAP